VSLQEVDWRSDLLEKYVAAHAQDLELGRHEWKNLNQVRHEIENLPPEKKAEFALTIADYLRPSVEENSRFYYDLSIELNKLLGPVPSYNVADLLRLFDWSLSQISNYYRCVPRLLALARISQKEHGRDKELNERLERLIEVVAKERIGKQEKDWISAAKAMLGNQAVRPPVITGEAWADAVIADVEAGALAPKSDWLELLRHCQQAGGGTPNAKWLKTAAKSLDVIGFDDFRAALLRWFPLVDKPRTQLIERWAEWQPNPNLLLNDVNADILKGLVWLCAQREDKELARALCALAISTYRKVPGVGPRSARVGNACVWALGNLPGMEGIGQLALLKLKVKFGTAQKGIEKAMLAAANRMGLPPAEIEELSVPAYGLQAVGCTREQLGEFTAELVITGTHDVELRWRKPDGKPQSSVPKAVKEGHSEQLKELQQAAKDIVKMSPAQRDRIENLYLEQKRWPFAIWRERYLDHPLIGALARRLIWRFSQGERQASAIWWDGQLVGVNGAPLAWLPMAGPDDATIVELWHPLYESTEQALAWREWLNQHEVRQPFKQAHREIYVLTEAERNTSVYSNRFAAHIIKQHQFNALCANRAWKNKLRLMVDDCYPPAQRHMAAWNLRAEFWIEGLGDNYGTDTNQAGSYLYLTTDQVRFYPLEAPQHLAHASGGGYNLARLDENVANEPLQLTEIPPLVFTEIMRDVDLFVGVASVANDPNWADGGANGRHVDYWRNHSFGELTATAATRKQVLERLVPRLKIADRCRFGERFLIVQGELRTYKIHLGSGNILMEPNDQYLCIVPGQGVAESVNGKIFLPFEGDNMLAIILSKAFLLADDKNIKDPTIMRQLH
jgi:hypothetical protein